MADYRARLYRHYKNPALTFDPVAADAWGRSYESYLRGWLPAKTSAIGDLGCGDGALLYFFKTRGFTDLSGVDVSPSQVELARQVVPTVELGGAIDFLAARPERFDLLSALDILEHLRKDEVLPFLDGCLRALKPGGRLLLQTPNGDSPFGNSIRYGDFTHEVCFTPSSLRWLLSVAGFGEFEARPTGPVPHSLPSLLRTVAWRGLSIGLDVWNIVETGSKGDSLHTRVFLAMAQRPA